MLTKLKEFGWTEWTRTADLMLIRHALYPPELQSIIDGEFLTLFPFWARVCGGGDDGIRTHDPLLAGQVLSQLSYTPICALQVKSAPQVKSLRGEFASR